MPTPPVAPDAPARRPNILLIVSDQERQRDWLPKSVSLPNRERLLASGVEFTRYFTHASPCSPSRASLFTGLYVPQHGVTENVIFPGQKALDPSIRTLGHRLRAAGYRTAYLGKWHLAHGPAPDMEAYGFADWEGNDWHFMGWAGTGVQFDPMIAAQAARWLAEHGAQQHDPRPWFLVVALVNPHDVMWFPADQPDYQAAHPAETARWREVLQWANWKQTDPLPPYEKPYPEVFSELPPNFDDDLFTKPAVQRQWMAEQQASLWGRIDPRDKRSWLRQLDYYVALHREADVSLGTVLDALDATGRADETAVLFTSDHGDMCGSHGLRSKGPFVYDEIVRIPLYARVPGVTPAGARTSALGSHVDLARTIASLAGAPVDGLAGQDLLPVMRAPATATARDAVLFSQEQSWYESCIPLRYASRGITDGRYKYARYFGCGGGFTQFGQPADTPQRVGPDAPFEDHDHELYDLQEDPHELVNLAMDRGHRRTVREWFARLREAEAREFGAR